MKKLAIFGVFVLFFWSCAEDASEPGRVSPTPGGNTTQKEAPAAKKPRKPKKEKAAYSHGDMNEILVIADQDVWEGTAGDSFFYYFAAPYILLPQPEPIFDIIHMTPEALADNLAKREFRTILFLTDLSDKSSLTTRLVSEDLGPKKITEAKVGKGYSTIVGKDKWAEDQILFYILGNNSKKLTENITENWAPIARRINEKDMETVEANAYQAGDNNALTSDILEKFGLKLRVPGDFKLAMYMPKKEIMWIRRDDRDLVANIIIHTRPYVNEKQLTREGIKKIQHEVGKVVTTQQPDTYMRINDEDLPLFVENKTINGLFTVEAKGIWDIVNDFKGGPFLSYLMLNSTTNELIFIDGFIYAPSKYTKRNYMQEMELILSSASLPKAQ